MRPRVNKQKQIVLRVPPRPLNSPCSKNWLTNHTFLRFLFSTCYFNLLEFSVLCCWLHAAGWQLLFLFCVSHRARDVAESTGGICIRRQCPPASCWCWGLYPLVCVTCLLQTWEDGRCKRGQRILRNGSKGGRLSWIWIYREAITLQTI